jgi:hypothetical protein
MPQIKFSVTDEAVAYLRWFARNVLFEKSENDAARYLMMKQLEKTRRMHRKDEPSPEDLVPIPPASGSDDKD